MRYAAVIAIMPGVGGMNNMLEDVAPYFANAIAKIRRLNNEWILDSSSFDACGSFEDAYENSKVLLSLIGSILTLYIGYYGSPLYISSVVRLTDDDKLISRPRVYSYPLKINVRRPAKEAFSLTASGSLATDLISRATTDPAIKEALSLVGHAPLTWGQIYDIIEFLGGARAIEKSGFASKSETRRVRQTANHHRHLGRSAKNNRLPLNPPTQSEARRFTTNLLKKWITMRI